MRLSNLIFGKEKLPPKGTKITVKIVFATDTALDAYDAGADAEMLHRQEGLEWMILASDLTGYLRWVQSHDDKALLSRRTRKAELKEITRTGPGLPTMPSSGTGPLGISVYAVALVPFRMEFVYAGRTPAPGEWFYEKDLLAFLKKQLQLERENPNLEANPLADVVTKSGPALSNSLLDHIAKCIENEKKNDARVKKLMDNFMDDFVKSIQATSKPMLLPQGSIMTSPPLASTPVDHAAKSVAFGTNYMDQVPRPPLSKLIHSADVDPGEIGLCLAWTEDGFLYLLPNTTPRMGFKVAKWAFLDDITMWLLQGLETDPETGNAYDEDLEALVYNKDQPIKYKSGPVMLLRRSDEKIKWVGIDRGGKPNYDIEDADYWFYELDFMQFIDDRLEEEANPVKVTFTHTEPKGDLIRFQDARVKQILHIPEGGENQPERFIIKLSNLGSNEQTIVTTEYAQDAQKFKAGKVYRFSVNELE